MQLQYFVIVITTSNLKEARTISKALIKDRKAACVNIIKNIESCFYWQDKLQREKEVLLIVKSAKVHFKDIVKIAKKHHSYKVPEIIALPIARQDKDYQNWMKKVLR